MHEDRTPTSAELPRDHPYLANLAALWAREPALAALVEASDERGEVEADESAFVAQLAAVALEGAGGVYLFGLGAGGMAEAVFDRTGGAEGEARLFIFDPDLGRLRAALWGRDLSRLIDSGRVGFVWADDKAALFATLGPHTAMLSGGVEMLAHPPSANRHPAFYAAARQHVGAFASLSRTSIHTLVQNGRRTAETVARNLSRYVASPGIGRLRDAHLGKPAIVVSAGPSLRKNQHLLKEAQGRAVIVAVQTTLKPLLAMGVVPQFVTSLDWHDICGRFFEGLPADLPTELVAEPKATAKVFDSHTGPASLLGNDFAEGLLREMKLGRPKLPPGATVAHLAWSVAKHLGCDPIVFVGQDLAFSDGLCYAPGTSYDDVWRPETGRFCTVEMKQWEQIARDRNILRRVPATGGGEVYTEERLFTYLQQFEREFSEASAAGKRVIDATEGGAAKRGAVEMKLAEALESFCSEEVNLSLPPHPGLRFDRLGEAADCLRRRREEAAEIEAVGVETLPLLEEVRDHLGDQSRVNRCIARIDRLRARMNGLGATYDLILQLSQKGELDRFHADRAIKGGRLDATEKQRRQVGRDVENVRHINAAAGEFKTLMGEVVERLESGAAK